MKQNMNKIKKIVALAIVIIALVVSFFLGIIVQKNISKSDIYKVNFEPFFQELVGQDTCYTIGHKSPDTDTVCSAILVADILTSYGLKCEARISGKLNNETKFILEKFGIAIPEIMDNAEGKKIVLVDHSEYAQMIDGMKNAEIISIFDHHGVGNVSTNGPIIYEGLNVGATASIIYKIYKNNGLHISKKAAYLIASAIVSDTNNLKGSTTTKMDRYALAETVKISGIKNVNAFYEKMKEAAESYDGMTETEIFLSDYKEYEMSGNRIGIACINTPDKNKLEEMKKRMQYVMSEIYEKKDMKHLFVVINNSKDNQSNIIGYGNGTNEILEQAFGSTEFIFNPSASRKKVIVPRLQEIYKKNAEE